MQHYEHTQSVTNVTVVIIISTYKKQTPWGGKKSYVHSQKISRHSLNPCLQRSPPGSCSEPHQSSALHPIPSIQDPSSHESVRVTFSPLRCQSGLYFLSWKYLARPQAPASTCIALISTILLLSFIISFAGCWTQTGTCAAGLFPPQDPTFWKEQ